MHLHSSLLDGIGQVGDVKSIIHITHAAKEACLRIERQDTVGNSFVALCGSRTISLGVIRIVVPIFFERPTRAMTSNDHRIVEGVGISLDIIENLKHALCRVILVARIFLNRMMLNLSILIGDLIER